MLLSAKEFLKYICTDILLAHSKLKPAAKQYSIGKHQNVTAQNRENYYTAYFTKENLNRRMSSLFQKHQNK